MSTISKNAEPVRNASDGLVEIVEALKTETDRLNALANELKAKEVELAEMREMFPIFKKLAYRLIRKQHAVLVPELPHDDLERLALEDGALTLEDFVHELESVETRQ